MQAEGVVLPAFLIVLVAVIFAVAVVGSIAMSAWLLTRGRPDKALLARLAEMEDTTRLLEARLAALERARFKAIDPDETHIEPAP